MYINIYNAYMIGINISFSLYSCVW